MMSDETAKNNRYLANAAKEGRMDLILSMIKKNKLDYGFGLNGACMGGHIEIALMMIECGATNLNQALKLAHSRGHRELVLAMIFAGASLEKVEIILTNNDIMYLLRHKVKEFGKHTKFAAKWEKWVKDVGSELDIMLISDLTDIVLSLII